jgi:hypothetical protein
MGRQYFVFFHFLNISSGQLGDNTTDTRTYPIEMRNTPKNVIKISTGVYNTHLLTNDSKVYGMGMGNTGSIGDNMFEHRSIPTMTDLSNLGNEEILGIYSSHHSVLLTSRNLFFHFLENSKVFTYGANSYGQLCNLQFTNQPKPSSIFSTPLTNRKIIKISIQSYTTFMLLEDGTIYGCGYNLEGQLADGTLLSKPIPTLALLPRKIVDLNTGYFHSIALLKTIKTCYGVNETNSNVCSGHGVCVQSNVCVCQVGYSGLNCNQTNVCNGLSIMNSTLLCSGNGKCSESNGCVCNDGWRGSLCDQQTNCFGFYSNDTWTCSGNGVCVTNNQCKCNRYYTGNQCQFRVIPDALMSW